MHRLNSALKSEIQKVRSLIPASFRYGAPYRRQLKFLTESQYFSREELEAYQLKQMQQLLRHCFEHVPYYRELAAGIGCTARDFQSIQDLKILPVLTREIVRDRQAQLYAENIPASRRLRRFTGGTGGQPLGFVIEAGRTDPLERAFVARIWNWFGARFEDPAAIVRGYAVDPARLRQGIFWQPWYPERTWACFSSYHMSEDNLPAYARQLRELNPVFISCVASDLDPLARFWVEHGLPRLPRLRFVHQSGMLMYPEQRERFEQAFGVRAFSTYGQSECSVFASECEHSTDYHLFSEYGVTEVLRQNGALARAEEIGEIVATGFNNYAMPLLRYRTGDLGSKSARRCECGRAFPLLSDLEGRGQYMVVLSDGLVVGLNSILYGSHMPELKSMKQVQVHQEKPGELLLLVVPTANFDEEAGRRLARGLEKVADEKLHVQVRLVEEIPRAAGEKFKILVQKLRASWWTGFESEDGTIHVSAASPESPSPVPTEARPPAAAFPAPPSPPVRPAASPSGGPEQHRPETHAREFVPAPLPASAPARRGVFQVLKGEAQRVRSLVPASLRYGSLYRRTEARLQLTQFYDEERLRQYQVQELRRLLRHARAHVPYYARVMKEVGLDPDGVRSPDDIRALPLLSKEDIHGLLPELLATNFGPASRAERTTGGTTGTPLAFFVERGRTDALERAFISRFWRWQGVRFEDRSVILKGMVVSDRLLREGIFWQTSYPERHWTFFSAHHLSDEHLPSYARKIRELRPVFLQSFPSGLDLLARYWIQAGLEPLPGLRLIHVSSETLRPDQRNRFERAFGARVFSNYGQSEGSVLASECEHDTSYHVFPEYGVTEILRADGTPTAPGEIGELVGTGFNNGVMPLLRYRTGDLGAWSRRRCVCGRAFPLLEQLDGRGQDVVVALGGHILPLNALIFGAHLSEYRHVKEMQIRQRVKGEIELAIVPYPSFTQDIGEQICRRLERVADGGLRIRHQVESHIPLTAGGKFRLLVQDLPATWWGRGGSGDPAGL